MLKILFISPEMEPIAKVGGLADVIGALPKTLKGLGCDVRVVMPLYKHAKDNLKRFNLPSREINEDVITCIDSLPIEGEILETEIDGVTVYLLKNDSLYDREYIYSTPSGDYDDNDLRFAFLSLGALEITKALDFKPDVIHCHDWQTALVPACLKFRKHLKDDLFFHGSKIVFTIHNLAYQGQFGKEILDELALPWFLFTPQGIEFYGKVNLLKGGIVYSDIVTTVSRTYAEEIKTPQYGCGLDGILRAISNHTNKLVGIINGIDNDEWNPEKDSALYANYSVDSIERRLENKFRLRNDLGLSIANDKPLLGMVSRLTEQKGTDLIAESLSQIFDLGFQVVILGSGEEKFERMLQAAKKRDPENMAVITGFNDDVARRIYAGSDFFLMPSRFEPCGLGQMIAMRYGSIPVVRGTGGLLDTVVDYNSSKQKSNGFVFNEFSKVGFLDALVRGLSLYEKKEEWKRLVIRAMREDFSWKRSSELYLELYRSLKSTDVKGEG